MAKVSITTCIDTKKDVSYLRFIVNYKKSRVYVRIRGIEVKKSEWEKGRFIEGRGKASNKHKQCELDMLKADLMRFVLKYLESNVSLPSKELLESFVNGEEVSTDILEVSKPYANDVRFLSFVSDTIKKRGAGESSYYRHSYSENTLKCYGRFQNCFKEFEQLRGSEVLLSDFADTQILEEFKFFLVNKGYLINTIGERLKSLKLFLNEALKSGRIPFNPFARFGLRIPKVEVEAIALTEEELIQLEQLDLSQNPSLSIIRDHYICMCFTGLRISDYLLYAKKDSIEEVSPIQNIKTKEISYVPTLPPVKRILSKHQNSFPQIYTEQYINRKIKDIFKLIPGFDQNEAYTRVYGSGSKTFNVPRYKLVTNHTARRTLVTMLLRQGFTYDEVMAMTGHRDIRSIRSYNRIPKKELAQSIMNRFKDRGLGES